MLTGFSLEEEIWVSLEEDTGAPKTEFCIRPIPAGKLDELRARSFDVMRQFSRGEDEIQGADLTESRRYNREVVRWGIQGQRNGDGGLRHFHTEQASFGDKEFSVVADATLEVYERTILSRPAPEPEGEGVESAGDRTPRTIEQPLLDRLAWLVMQHQTLSQAERRGLHGAGVAGP